VAFALAGVLAKLMAGLSAKAIIAARTTAGFVSFDNQLVIIALLLFCKEDPASTDHVLIERRHEINKLQLSESVVSSYRLAVEWMKESFGVICPLRKPRRIG
jgi:hypothetical protein